MATNDTLIGRLVAGRYRLVERLGAGASGAVFAAIDDGPQRSVIVKLLRPVYAATPDAEARFRAQAQVAASASHPNLTSTLDFGVEEIEGTRLAYLVVEPLSGGSLRDMMDRGRLLSPSQALMVGLDVCRGLDFVHKRGVILGDLRPASIVFGDDRHAHIADVGISRLVTEQAWQQPSGVGLDVARYASPEQARGASLAEGGTLTAATDIYSLALVLVEAVTGQVPFSADSTVATLNARQDKLLPVTADFGPLASILSRAANPSAEDRYSAADFGRALLQAAEKLPRPAPLPIVGYDSTGGIKRPADASGQIARPNPVAAEAAGAAAALDAAAADTAIAAIEPEVAEPAIAAPGTPEPVVDEAVEADPDTVEPDVADADVAGPDVSDGVVVDVAASDGPEAESAASAESTSDLAAERPTAGSDTSASRSADAPRPPVSRTADDPAPTAAVAGLADSGGRGDSAGPTAAVPPVVPPTVAVDALTRTSSGEPPPPPQTPMQALPDPGAFPDPTAADQTGSFSVSMATEPRPTSTAPRVRSTPPTSTAPPVAATPAPAAVPVPAEPGMRIAPRALDQTGETHLYDQTDDEVVPRPRRRAGFWVLVGVLLLAAAAGGALLANTFLAEKKHAVPNVVGLEESVARNQVSEFDWVVIVQNERSDEQEAGRVVRTDPPAGEQLAEGSSLVFVVSMGPTLSTLPDVEGLTRDAAEQALVGAKLTMTVAGEEYCEATPPAAEALASPSITCADVPGGSVVSWRYEQQPNTPAGAQVMPNTSVAVVLSKGPAPRVVPSLKGLDEATATATITGLGLTPGKADDIFSVEFAAGLVGDQLPVAGEPIEKGATLTYALSKGPEMVAMPTIEGQTPQQLQDAIATAGLVVGTVTGPADGTGILQSVTAGGQAVTSGQSLVKGTVIDIAYAAPPPPSTTAPTTTG